MPDFAADLGRDLTGMRLAYPRRFFAENPATTTEALTAIDTAAETLAALGAQVEQVDLPSYSLFEAAGRAILVAEAYAIHEQDLKTRLAYGRYTYQRIAAGAVLSAADLLQAYRLRRELAASVNAMLAQHDGIIAATGISTAPRFDSFAPDVARWTAMLTIPFPAAGPGSGSSDAHGARGPACQGRAVSGNLRQSLMPRDGA